jgi:hypothetical protein
MVTNKWLDRTQPQTLYIATMILYINAVFGLLSLFSGGGGVYRLIELLYVIGLVAGGWGIANEKKLLYWVAVVVAVFPIGLIFYVGLASTSLISVLFEIALVALLLHPMSRSYKNTWFR